MTNCPSVFELTSTEVLPPQVIAHLNACDRCRAIRAAWEASEDVGPDLELGAGVALEWPHAVYAAIDGEPIPGALHAVWGDEDGQLLVAAVVEINDREALVVPVSDRPELAGDWDLLLEGDEATPYPAMLEVWNHIRVLREQLMEQVALLDENRRESLRPAFVSFMTGEDLPAGLRQGPPMLSELDPRFRFRDSESARVRLFTEPWRVLFAGDTFGGVVRNRREERELGLADLGEELDIPPASLDRLEHDGEDLDAQLPRNRLIRLIKRLGLPTAARLTDLVHQAAMDNAREPPPQNAMALARRKGVGTRRPELPEDTRREIADRYVSGLLEALRENA